jgi:xanthine dehydrogenase accessory factor
MKSDRPLVLIRGGGDLATGAAARLHRSGFAVVITEIAQPMAVRRLVALAEAVYAGDTTVEDLTARRVDSPKDAIQALSDGFIPVLVDPEAYSCSALEPLALVDARMLKRSQPAELGQAPFVIGLGPGFVVGENCHAVVETKRGHSMGRVLWQGSAEADTGIPGKVSGHAADRVLRAPSSGEVFAGAALGSLVKQGDRVATVGGVDLMAPFDGALRGLLHDGVQVAKGAKVGDVDPRGNAAHCFLISDKSLAIGGAVLEALLSRPFIRQALGA